MNAVTERMQQESIIIKNEYWEYGRCEALIDLRRPVPSSHLSTCLGDMMIMHSSEGR